jgi:hypothetical protein
MPNGYPPPVYYPPRRTNWAGIVAGLVAVGIGGYFVYWAWKQGWFNGGCTEGAIKCQGIDRYKCVNGKWALSVPGAPECQDGNGDYGCHGTCYYENIIACSSQGALCKCVNHAWQLQEVASSLCDPSAPKHNACFNSYNNIITCLEIPGQGNDLCYEPGYSGGCSCATSGICDEYHYCLPSDNRCVRVAKNKFVHGSKTTSEKDLILSFDLPFVADTMSYCRVDYENAGFIETINWSLWGTYNGMETLICDGFYLASGSSGYFWIPANVAHEIPWAFPVQGFDGMKINFANTNADPKAFQGTFNFQ